MFRVAKTVVPALQLVLGQCRWAGAAQAPHTYAVSPHLQLQYLLGSQGPHWPGTQLAGHVVPSTSPAD